MRGLTPHFSFPCMERCFRKLVATKRETVFAAALAPASSTCTDRSKVGHRYVLVARLPTAIASTHMRNTDHFYLMLHH